MTVFLTGVLLVPMAWAQADASEEVDASSPLWDLITATELHADLKSFWMGSFPYEHLLMPEEPSATGAVDGRVRLDVDLGDLFRLQVHHAVTATTGAPEESLGVGFGVGLEAPEALDLSWQTEDGADMTLAGRTDRLVIESTIGSTEWAIGRQPISFGQGRFFAPLDLVSPFHAATIDSEYKPGVDALRFGVYPTMSTEITAVAAYTGDWEVDAMVFALYAQHTIGVTDLGLFAGAIRGDAVGGLSAVSALGPVGVYGDLAVTMPGSIKGDDEDEVEEEDPFVRVALGFDHRLTGTTSVGLELYHQSLGAASPDEYLDFASSERFGRGELWTMGRTYAGLSVLQEITPLTMLSVAALTNLEDGSALLLPSLALSIAENADAVLGGFLGVGARPEEIDLLDLVDGNYGIQSEFGLYPHMAFIQMRSYF